MAVTGSLADSVSVESAGADAVNQSLSPRAFVVIVILLCLLGTGLRVVDVWRPVDGSMRDSWREPDVAGIARNFYLEGMNPFYPRIDWRGDGPGYVEAEFPIYPWTTACLYHVFGYHEELLRVVSCSLSLLLLALFVRVATEYLQPLAALLAIGFFCLNPLAIRMASAIQPEPLMCLAYVAAAFWFERWCRTLQRGAYLMALSATTLAILAKIPAAHIGILMAGLCFQHFGWRAILRLDVWLFAVVSLLIPAWWYWHAHWMYETFGNSLGMSNEAYLRIASLSFVDALAQTVPGIFRTQCELVWTPAGLVIGTLGGVVAVRDVQRRWFVMWTVALVAYFIVSGRTTSEDWATHYHIVSVTVACLLMGLGAATALTWSIVRLQPIVAANRPDWHTVWTPALQRNVGVALLVGVLAVVLCVRTSLGFAKRTFWDMHPRGFVELYECARKFRPYLGETGLIVASGASQVDQWGIERAYNAPYFFFWTGHKGFTLGNAEQSVGRVEELRQRGAQYLIAERRSLRVRPEFESELKQCYRLLAEHPLAILVELTPQSDRLLTQSLSH